MLLGAVASGRGMALLPQSFTRLRRAGVAYRSLAEGDALPAGIGLATPRDRPALRDQLAAVARMPVVAHALTLGRWRGERGDNEGRIHGAAGALSFVRNGQRVPTDRSAALVGGVACIVLGVVWVVVAR